MPVAKIPLSALRVADGQFAATLAIHGLDPMSLVFEASKLEDLVTGIDVVMCKSGGSRHSEEAHRLVRRGLDQTMRQGDAQAKEAAMLSVLWLALNHPHHSDQMRLGTSQALRSKGRCHLSVTVDARRTWVFALADRWVDMAPLLKVIPTDQHISMSYVEQAREKAFQ